MQMPSINPLPNHRALAQQALGVSVTPAIATPTDLVTLSGVTSGNTSDKAREKVATAVTIGGGVTAVSGMLWMMIGAATGASPVPGLITMAVGAFAAIGGAIANGGSGSDDANLADPGNPNSPLHPSNPANPMNLP